MTHPGVQTKSLGALAAEFLDRIHQRHPLIHHMTNWVVMNDTANATLALGALPVMSHAKEEVAEMVGAAGALAGAGGEVKGVESVQGVADPAGVARMLASRRATVVAITGKRDIISDGTRVLGVDNGHELLKTVTGTGCMATTVIAIFCAVESDKLLATAAALAVYGLAAQKAARGARGPGSFRTALLDCLYNLTPAEVMRGARIVEIG